MGDALPILGMNQGHEPASTAGDFRDEINREMARLNLSQSQLSKEAGVDRTGASKFNQWLSGTYSGDNQAIERALRVWLANVRSREAVEGELPVPPAWIDTPTAESIHACYSYAQVAGVMGCVYGGAGLGKTLTAEHYKRGHANVWIVTAAPWASTANACLRAIGAVLGLREQANGDRLAADILERMKNTRGLLIIDEAQHLSVEALEVVRSLFDASRVGVVLVGNDRVYSRLTGGTRSAQFAQLFRRLSKRQRLTQPSREDVEKILMAWGVNSQGARSLCHDIAQKPGALGVLTETLRLATMLSRGEPITEGSIRAAWHDLGGE